MAIKYRALAQLILELIILIKCQKVSNCTPMLVTPLNFQVAHHDAEEKDSRVSASVSQGASWDAGTGHLLRSAPNPHLA